MSDIEALAAGVLAEAADLERHCRRRMAEGCLLLAHSLAKKAYHGGRWPNGTAYGDVDGEALLGLSRAASFFDPRRGHRFTSYAHRAISNQLRVYYTACWRACRGWGQPGASYLDIRRDRYDTLDRHVDSHHRMADIEDGAPGPVLAAELAEARLLLMRVPCPRRREMARRVLMDGELLRVVAKDEGVTKERVRQHVLRAIAEMRGPLQLEEWRAEDKIRRGPARRAYDLRRKGRRGKAVPA